MALNNMDKIINPCIIDAIVKKQTLAYIVAENESFIAFLDHRPVFPGHTLVAPKEHIQNLYELPEQLIQDCFTFVKKVGKAVESGMNAQGTFIAINNTISQSIPHLHIHVIPRNKGDGLKGFFWPRISYKSVEHMLQTQKLISQHFIISHQII